MNGADGRRRSRGRGSEAGAVHTGRSGSWPKSAIRLPTCAPIASAFWTPATLPSACAVTVSSVAAPKSAATAALTAEARRKFLPVLHAPGGWQPVARLRHVQARRWEPRPEPAARIGAGLGDRVRHASCFAGDLLSCPSIHRPRQRDLTLGRVRRATAARRRFRSSPWSVAAQGSEEEWAGRRCTGAPGCGCAPPAAGSSRTRCVRKGGLGAARSPAHGGCRRPACGERVGARRTRGRGPPDRRPGCRPGTLPSVLRERGPGTARMDRLRDARTQVLLVSVDRSWDSPAAWASHLRRAHAGSTAARRAPVPFRHGFRSGAPVRGDARAAQRHGRREA